MLISTGQCISAGRRRCADGGRDGCRWGCGVVVSRFERWSGRWACPCRGSSDSCVRREASDHRHSSRRRSQGRRRWSPSTAQVGKQRRLTLYRANCRRSPLLTPAETKSPDTPCPGSDQLPTTPASPESPMPVTSRRSELDTQRSRQNRAPHRVRHHPFSNIHRPPIAEVVGPQMASVPRSPVRTRTIVSRGADQILPSPILPVRAA